MAIRREYIGSGKKFIRYSPEEMAEIFSDIPDAIENTQEIVAKVEAYSIDSGPIMPIFDIPKDFGTVEEYITDILPIKMKEEPDNKIYKET